MVDLQEIQRREVRETEKNTSLVIDLNSYERFNVASEPTNGTIVIRRGNLIYTPETNFTGTDFLSYTYVSRSRKRSGLFVFNVTENIFKPRARLLLQLGDQLIKNESIALVELVKNSYDADASYAKVTMTNVDDAEMGMIVIEDDGQGMTIKTIRNSWLEPGSDQKVKQLEEKTLTPKFHRLPIGEKGIGRFGVHKLGNRIELVTKSEGEKEVVVEIDWKEFSKHKYLKEAPVSILQREPEEFRRGRTGTKITITNLRSVWTRGMVRDVKRAVVALTTPTRFVITKTGETRDIEEKSSFVPDLIVDNTEWLKGIPNWDEIKEYALFFFDIEIEGASIKKFRYHFQPWDRMSKLEPRTVTENNEPISELLELIHTVNKKPASLDLGKYKIGKVKLSGCIFVKDRGILKMALNQPGIISDYLRDNGGVRVYRDGMRIYDYGEPENDWLQLDQRRFNTPAFRISNNMIIASIDLDREKSTDLVEKTNREGFVDNEAYQSFKDAILYCLNSIEISRRVDKNKIDAIYGSIRKREAVEKSIEDLRSLVTERVRNEKDRKDIETYIDRIEKNYKFMNEILIKSASAGLGWSVYIHEIQKIIEEIDKVVSKEKSYDRALKLIRHLSEIIESYAQILRRTNRKEEDLIEIIDQSLFNIEFRLRAHNVEIIKEYKSFKGDQRIKIARNLVIGTIMNLIDNSIYWLERAGRKNKKIFLKISNEERGFLSIVIADNGPGFALPTDEITEPFVTAKPDGLGLGLHIAKEIMLSHGGKISFNDEGDFDVPIEFEKGATVILGFKK